LSGTKGIKKPVDEAEIKRKAVKLVVAHLKKKVTREYMGFFIDAIGYHLAHNLMTVTEGNTLLN
jgi:proteasome lid subunit RPN8/RPN11